MNYKDAFEILEIDLTEINYNNISLKYLRKQYKRLALKNHPDKNGNSFESNEKFKKINEAYDFLNNAIKHFNQNTKNNDNRENNEEDDIHKSSLYFEILKSFMKTVFKGNYNDLLSKIVNDIINAGKKISAKLFDDLDKDTTLNIYTFLSNNKTTLHLNQDILEIIRGIVVKKYDKVEVYKLNPSINDLLNNNLYKLYVHNNLFLVPLWHSESYFDNSGCEIIVICEPELPKYISIDDDNNICVETEISVYHKLPDLIMDNGVIFIEIGNKEFNIRLSNLYIKREQNYRIKNEGLSKIKKDIYDVSEKTDIIITIKLI
jgi:hypothetical protein